MFRLRFHVASMLREIFGCRGLPLLARAAAEPPIPPRTPPACVSPGFINPVVATLQPGANFLRSLGRADLHPERRAEHIIPGLSEALPGVATLTRNARRRRARRNPLSNNPGQEGQSIYAAALYGSPYFSRSFSRK